jgi:glycosyltransferase involved in cell wall biosynthesis
VVKLHGSRSYISKLLNNKVHSHKIFLLERNTIMQAAGIIAISKISSKINCELFDIRKPVVRIYNGILPERTLKYCGNKSNIVVFAGTLVEMKGIFQLAEAWKIVKNQFPLAELHVFGKGKEHFLSKMNHKIPEGILLEGVVSKPDLIHAYSQAACAVFPSFIESFAMAPMESMSVGCPTIYTKLSSGPELISNQVDGFLVDPNDIQQIADAIIYCFNHRDEALKVGIAGKLKIERHFDISKIAKEHLHYYQSILTHLS